MKTYDIKCAAEGWTYLVDGVRVASYPSWFMALNAARMAAERDAQKGIMVALRYQGLDGQMHPVQSKRPGAHAAPPAPKQGRVPVGETETARRATA